MGAEFTRGTEVNTLTPCPHQKVSPKGCGRCDCGPKAGPESSQWACGQSPSPGPARVGHCPLGPQPALPRGGCVGQLRVPAHTFHTFQEERKVCTVAGGRSAQRLGLGQELPPHPHGRASAKESGPGTEGTGSTPCLPQIPTKDYHTCSNRMLALRAEDRRIWPCFQGSLWSPKLGDPEASSPPQASECRCWWPGRPGDTGS